MVLFNPARPMGKVNAHAHDAFACLTREHNIIRRLFLSYDKLVVSGSDNETKAEAAGQICFKWCVHTQIEEEIFYPAVTLLLGEEFRLQHSLDDHAGSRELVAMLDELDPGDANFDPAVAMLAAYVLPHIDEEEDVLFARLLQIGMETSLMGHALEQRQKVLNGNSTQAWQPQSSGRTQSGDSSGSESASS